MATLHPVPADFAAHARIGAMDYEKLYAESVRDADGFWRRIGKRLSGVGEHRPPGTGEMSAESSAAAVRCPRHMGLLP